MKNVRTDFLQAFFIMSKKFRFHVYFQLQNLRTIIKNSKFIKNIIFYSKNTFIDLNIYFRKEKIFHWKIMLWYPLLDH